MDSIDAETISRMQSAGIPRPDNVSGTEWSQVKDPKPLHLTIAQMAASGARAKDIADLVGMTREHISVVLKSPAVKLEIKRIQHRLFGRDPQKRFRLMMESALDVHQEILESPQVKPATRLAAVDMVYDRAHGKPKQQIEHTGSLLRGLIEAIDKSNDPAPIDVTPASPAEDVEVEAAPKKEMNVRHDFDDWLTDNFSQKKGV